MLNLIIFLYFSGVLLIQSTFELLFFCSKCTPSFRCGSVAFDVKINLIIYFNLFPKIFLFFLWLSKYRFFMLKYLLDSLENFCY